MIVVHLRGRVRQGRWDDFLAFLAEAVPFYEAPGGIRIRLLRGRDDPDAFVEVVEYDDVASYERDQVRVSTDADMGAYLDRWRGLLDGAPEVETYQEVPASEGGDRP